MTHRARLALPVARPVATYGVNESCARSCQVLLAITSATIILSPSHFRRVRMEVLAADMVVSADLSATETREEAFGLIGVNAFFRIAFLMVDPLGQELGV